MLNSIMDVDKKKKTNIETIKRPAKHNNAFKIALIIRLGLDV